MSNTQYDLVDAFGFQVAVPEGFPWVTITRVHMGLASSLALVAFSAEPTQAKSGRWVAQEGTSFEVLQMVPGDTNVDLSKYIMNVNSKGALLDNAQETIDRLTAILADEKTSKEDKIHAIYCPEHGLLGEWLDATQSLAEQFSSPEEEEEEEEEHPDAIKELISFFEAQGLKVIAKRV